MPRYQVCSGSVDAEVEAPTHQEAALIAVRDAPEDAQLGAIMEVRALERRDLRYVNTVRLLQDVGLMDDPERGSR